MHAPAMDQTNTARTAPAAGFGEHDPRRTLLAAAELATAAIDAVRPDQLEAPTPCSDMDVRRLLGHLVMVGQRIAGAGRGEDPATWPGEVVGLADDQWAGAWRAAVDDIGAVWADDDVLGRRVDLPWATQSGTEVAHIYTNEITVHTWDLARATGQSPAWDPRVLQVALDAIHAELPAERAPLWEQAKGFVSEDYPWEDPFGDAVAVPADAPLIDRLVAWNGRTP
ncbi:TIGR03086 family metal-binding protein [soil metagenome]